MLRPISRITHACLLFVLGPGLTLGALPQFGGIEIEARKKKAKAPGIATQSIVLAPHVDRGHKTVVVTVANIGKRGASSVRIAMQATRSGGAVRKPEVSGPLSVTKGETTTVEFHLGCH